MANKNCNYCNYCYSCNYCNYCYHCNYCYSCDYCDYCDYCKNIKMTERNIFCYSEKYNDENSFQQKRYRAFNKEVGEERYLEIRNTVNKILDWLKLELKDNSREDEWKKVTPEQRNKLLEIPEASDFIKWFEYISWVKIQLEEEIEEMTVADIEKLVGKKVKIIK